MIKMILKVLAALAVLSLGGAGLPIYQWPGHPVIVASGIDSINNGGTVTNTFPSDVVRPGDIIVLCAVCSQDDDAGAFDCDTIETGYSGTADENDTADNNETSETLYQYKVMGDTPDTQVRVTGSGDTADGVVAAYVAIRFGAVSGIPYLGEGRAECDDCQPNPPSIGTNLYGRSLGISCASEGAMSVGSAGSVSAPTGWNLLHQEYRAETNDAILAIAYRVYVTNQGVNPGAWSGFPADASGGTHGYVALFRYIQ